MPSLKDVHICSKVDSPINDWGVFRKSLLFAELSQIAYLREEQATDFALKAGFPITQFFEVDGAQTYMFANESDLVIACRGTEPREWNDIKADLNALPIAAETIGHVHRGFKKEVDDLWPLLEYQLVYNTKELWLCGHSLGGAMAMICASRCKLSYISSNPLELFTYGSPRVGTTKYVTYCDVKHLRWVNNNDIVTQVPPTWLGYRHVGREMYLNAYGQLRQLTPYQRLKDRYRGFKMGLKEGKIDNFSDHSITRYVEYIRHIYLESDEVETPLA